MRRLLVVVAAALAVASGCGARGGEQTKSTGQTFCDAIARLQAAATSAPIELAVDSSMSHSEVESRRQRAEDELAAAMDESEAALAALESTAPPEVGRDVEIVVAADRRYIDAIRASGFDIVSVATAARVGDPEVAAAVARIDSYSRGACGTSFDRLASDRRVPSAPPPVPVPDISIPEPPAPGEPLDHPPVEPPPGG